MTPRDADFKARVKADRNNYLTRIADEVEEDLQHNNMRSAFCAIKTLAGQKQSQPVLSCIQKMDGTPWRSNEEVMQRWSEHFTTALNHFPATTSTSLESESISAVPDPNVRTEKPTVNEVIRRHSPELLKCAVSRALHSLFIQVWRSGIVPADWQEGIIITLYKGKGPQTLCSNTTDQLLYCWYLPGKVFAHVLLARIQPLIDQCCRPQQSGFTAGRSTIDATLAL